MMKKITSVTILLFFCSFALGQTKIAELTFESGGGYSTSIPEFTDNARDYFIRTDESNITGEDVTNLQGSYYFAAQDINGEGALSEQTLLIKGINISGYSSLEFRVMLAEDDAGDGNEDWDNSDYVHFQYDIDDSGTYSNLIWIENNGAGTNQVPLIDTDFDGNGDSTIITNIFSPFTQNIIGTGEIIDILITFDLNAEDEDIAIDNIEIWGILNPCGTAVTWDGSVWSNGTGPDLTIPATLNGDYNTSTDGDISACSLTVSNNSTLTVANSTHVTVQNEINVDAGSEIAVQEYGAIVQNNDLSTNSNNGTITVDKLTAPMNAWYEYTYWSSPVSGETIAGAITGSNPVRRFSFNAQNFLDATTESNNDNTAVPGQDNIDDDNNVWNSVAGTTVMQAAAAYIMTLTPTEFDFGFGFPKTFRYTFTGDLHNGAYSVPIYRNDSEMNDYNWNLIGNPYPSGIDADDFLSANSNLSTDVISTKSINGALFLWSHNTAPSTTENGNATANFASSDYAIINAVGEAAGGDGITPNRFIPSGQAFFVAMSNSTSANPVSGDVYTANVVFSNSMRSNNTIANSQFFKSENSKSKTGTNISNKLWLNLTSDNGVFG
ncbi:MAG: hypothetical protein ACON5F_02175 [Jejuia sp.]